MLPSWDLRLCQCVNERILMPSTDSVLRQDSSSAWVRPDLILLTFGGNLYYPILKILLFINLDVYGHGRKLTICMTLCSANKCPYKRTHWHDINCL